MANTFDQARRAAIKAAERLNEIANATTMPANELASHIDAMQWAFVYVGKWAPEATAAQQTAIAAVQTQGQAWVASYATDVFSSAKWTFNGDTGLHEYGDVTLPATFKTAAAALATAIVAAVPAA